MLQTPLITHVHIQSIPRKPTLSNINGRIRTIHLHPSIDDETTVFFDNLPVISEESEECRLDETGTTILNHSLPPTPTLSSTTRFTPEIRIQVEEPVLPPLPLSPRSTGSGSGSGTRNGVVDDNVDFPALQYPDPLIHLLLISTMEKRR
ncbi:hypothetical protein M378DRAFT_15206 [Amanita muscaria Koide BX008]|uniref:Uncharacterized protein n=1 Tax=Amanita muscaria (strain Koide BX008) TaxID=946122 RepID=A0A0C2WQ71_AMAMK|nr:hypothetical protein M378DRAFT_15206 [Amanita muscaria Koide BX008]